MAAFGVQTTRDEVAAGMLTRRWRRRSRIGYPVAVKVNSADILHKTEAGGIRLGLADGDAVRAAFAEVDGETRGRTTPTRGSTAWWCRRWLPAA